MSLQTLSLDLSLYIYAGRVMCSKTVISQTGATNPWGRTKILLEGVSAWRISKSRLRFQNVVQYEPFLKADESEIVLVLPSYLPCLLSPPEP